MNITAQIVDDFLHSSNNKRVISEPTNVRSEINNILERSNQSSEAFNNFHCWQLNWLEIIKSEESHYIALLNFLQDNDALNDSQKSKLKRAVLEKKPQPVVISSSNVIEEITDFHISIFSYKDEYAFRANRATMMADLENHFTFLDQACAASSEAIWIEYLNWTRSNLKSLKGKTITLVRLLVSAVVILKTKKGPAKKIQLLDKGIKHLIYFSEEEQAKPKNKNSLIPEAQQYLDYLIKADRKDATEYIMRLVDKEHWTIKDIYMNVFQESQYEIGRLWEGNKVSVAQEHFCTATTQMIMSILYPRLLSGERMGRSVITTCVGSELHELGIRMVSDFLEMDGWDTYFIGANTPTEAIIESVEENHSDLLAVSVTLTPHVAQASEMIKGVRKVNDKIKILVGGYPFIQDPELFKKIGADGAAKSAQNIHEVALKLIEA